MMDIITSLLPVVLIGSYLFAWVVMIIHALTRPIPHRLLWLGVLILVPFLGVLGYYFAFYSGQSRIKPLKRPILIKAAVALMGLVGLITMLMLFPTSSRSHLVEVPLDEVIRRANNGEIHRIIIKGDELTIIKKGGTEPTERSRKKSDSSLYQQGLTNKQVKIDVITNK